MVGHCSLEAGILGSNPSPATMKEALIIVDVQNDFCNGISNGKEVIEPLNRIVNFARENGWLIVASRDWHTIGDHCIKNTDGASFNSDLLIDKDTIIISKENHSAFNNEGESLNMILRENNIKNVYIGGLATDFCVRNTAIDSVKNGYDTYIVWDASRGVFKKKSEEEVKKELIDSGIRIIALKEIIL